MSCPRGGTWGSWGSNPSVCLSHYLLQNHWTKSKQIWCVSYSHEWGMQQHIVFGPAPGDLGRGQKDKYHSHSITYSHFQRFLNQTLYIFPQTKDIKHIRQDFHSVTWVMPLGVGLGGVGVGGQICLSVMQLTP